MMRQWHFRRNADDSQSFQIATAADSRAGRRRPDVAPFGHPASAQLVPRVIVVRDPALADLDLLVRIDLEDEGVTPGGRSLLSDDDREAHPQLIRSFVLDGGAHVAEDEGIDIGAILWRARRLDTVRNGAGSAPSNRRSFRPMARLPRSSSSG
jgi:hypothetical protein